MKIQVADTADRLELQSDDNETVAVFDDITKNDDGVTYWSQICDACAKKHNIPENLLDRDSGSGICGVEGCNSEADHYIDFPNEETKAI